MDKHSIKLTEVKNISSVKGFVLKFEANLLFDDHSVQTEAWSGGNNILCKYNDYIIKLNFSGKQIRQKVELIHSILEDYAPTLFGTFFAKIEIDLVSRMALQDFIVRRKIPEEYMVKYNLFRTLNSQYNDCECFVMEHINGNHVDVQNVDISDIRHVMNRCLDAGIFPHDISRTSNILMQNDRVVFIDFDEWIVLNEQDFEKSLKKCQQKEDFVFDK